MARGIYALTSRGSFAKDFGLRDQIQRAAVSIGSNIAEGFERDSNPELVKFLSYAKGSAGEVISQLHTAFDIGYVTEQELQDMVAALKSLGAMLSKFQLTLKSAKIRGRYHRFPPCSATGHRELQPPFPQPETRNVKPETSTQRVVP